MSLPDILDPDFYLGGHHVSLLVAEAGLLAFIISAYTAIASLQSSLRKQSAPFFWLGLFALLFAMWNLLYLLAASQRSVEVLSTELSADWAEHLQLLLALFLPYLCQRFLVAFFGRKTLAIRLGPLLIMSLLTYAAIVQIFHQSDRRVLMIVGLFCFSQFGIINLKLWRLVQSTNDLKVRTRAFFIFFGLTLCLLFSLVGQIRADHIFGELPLPYLGTILTAVLTYFIYQMTLNPRLREVRELMLRGIRVILLTIILTVIFTVLLAWVGDNNFELFLFNTFIASFIILTVLEPLRKQVDRFFIRHFIVDRFEFEELLMRLPRKLRKIRSTAELTEALVNGIRESGRIYQAALFLWDKSLAKFRLQEPSNLTFVNTLETDDAFVSQALATRTYFLMEQDQELPPTLRDALRDRHAHIVLPLFKGDELLGLWALRTSLRSTNPYTSFSNEETAQLMDVSNEIVGVLEQIQHFETQDRQERLATLGEMSAALAHEIRNPLGAIYGSAQLLQHSPTLSDADDKECVEILMKESHRLQRTVDHYLAFVRKSDEPIAISLPDLALGIIDELKVKAAKTKTELFLESNEVIPPVKTDPHKLEQVLYNLIQNACEAFSPHVWTRLSVDHEKHLVCIDVRDDGPGIKPEHLNNVFNPLFTTKKAGSGLGLPICKKIIESLGGELTVESQLGRGTTFSIRLSLVEMPVDKPPQSF